MRHFRPAENSLAALRAVITVLTVFIISVLYYYIPLKKVVFISGAVIAGLALLIMFIYLPLYMSSVKYTATDSEVIRSSGVFIKFHQSVKYSSIQYAAVIRTPLSDVTGLNFVVFFVFGGHMRLSFLSLSDAREVLRLSGSAGGADL